MAPGHPTHAHDTMLEIDRRHDDTLEVRELPLKEPPEGSFPVERKRGDGVEESHSLVRSCGNGVQIARIVGDYPVLNGCFHIIKIRHGCFLFAWGLFCTDNARETQE